MSNTTLPRNVLETSIRVCKERLAQELAVFQKASDDITKITEVIEILEAQKKHHDAIDATISAPRTEQEPRHAD